MEKEKEQTFALVYCDYVDIGFLGVRLRDLEKLDMTIVGMKYMNVDLKFAEAHLSKEGRLPTADDYPGYGHAGRVKDLEFWIENFTEGPMVALLLEGEDVIRRAREYSLREWTFYRGAAYRNAKGGMYCSDSDKSAREDTELWFRADRDKWSDDFEGYNMVFVFKHILRGQKESVPFIYSYLGVKSYQELYYLETLRFVLIRPIAVRERLVGEIMEGFQCNSSTMRGLKLVNVNELPEDIVKSAWSTSETVDSPFGVAMVLEGVKCGRIRRTKRGGNFCRYTPETKILEVDKNLVNMSKQGAEAWKLIRQCFAFGFVLLPHQERVGILDASMLAGL